MSKQSFFFIAEVSFHISATIRAGVITILNRGNKDPRHQHKATLEERESIEPVVGFSPTETQGPRRKDPLSAGCWRGAATSFSSLSLQLRTTLPLKNIYIFDTTNLQAVLLT